MEAKDLRIENLIYYNEIEMVVSEINSPKPLKDKRYLDKYLVELFDGAGLITCALEEIQPIPLTEEWLLKFGKCRNEYFYSIADNATVDFKDKTISIFIEWSDCDIELKLPEYIHQLQNLYFALTGEELAYNI